ncbi:ComEA family DNA-binding protein [Streptomyces sp. CAU 1734]|uniref:ComEA family DNA-binding protein n=1 Tax=Streptomyces sp. CAU 1734 TaxID=3140360 RepID=UPI00325FE852
MAASPFGPGAPPGGPAGRSVTGGPSGGSPPAKPAPGPAGDRARSPAPAVDPEAEPDTASASISAAAPASGRDTGRAAYTRPAPGISSGPGPLPVPAVRAAGGLRRAGSALRERLPLWVRLRWGLEPRTLAALAVVLVVAAVLAVHHFWSGRPETVRAPDVIRPGIAEDGGTRGSAPERGPAPPAGPVRRITVDVSGRVRRPGVLRLPAGSRVADALNAAGGVRAGTDLTGLNRARVLADGEQVMVGVVPPQGMHGNGAASAGPAVSGVTGASGEGGPRAGAVLSLSSATAEQLDTLPGVGPVLARHIVDYRTRRGGFRSVDELREVRGIGDRRFADLRPLVQP